MVWSLALCPDDTKQDSVVYGAEFGVVFHSHILILDIFDIILYIIIYEYMFCRPISR